jgi:three-Cys-motif partner protein
VSGSPDPPTPPADDSGSDFLPGFVPPDPDLEVARAVLKSATYPIWTQNKARLIREYLYLFVMLTRHGSYIDGFAGPQEDGAPGMWAAKLALELRPPLLRKFWFRKFFLFEKDPRSFKLLEELIQSEPLIPNRIVEAHEGDFNTLVHPLLASGKIRPREATFCLLDQRTFECQWATVAALAGHRKTGHKIELFYFLAAAWFDRAVSGFNKPEDALGPWWGRDDWPEFLNLTTLARRVVLVERFRSELGYRYVYAWPIYNREKAGGRVMYYMIHASDHPQAPEFMSRAYEAAVRELPPEQPSLFDAGPPTQGQTKMRRPRTPRLPGGAP